MGYDASRPVPWTRLLRETALLLIVGSFVFLVVLGAREPGTFVGLALGGIIYLGVAALLSKFGYIRQTFKEVRTQSIAEAAEKARRKAATAPRNRPAPTKRTGGNQRRR